MQQPSRKRKGFMPFSGIGRLGISFLRYLLLRGSRHTARRAAYFFAQAVMRRLPEFAPVPVEPTPAPPSDQAIPSAGSNWKAAFSHFAKITLDALLAGRATIDFPRCENPTTSILIVTLNRAELTLACLNALRTLPDQNFEIILLDNGSTDATPALLDRLRGVRIIRSAENLGYPKAVNQASALARGRYLLLLNNDALVQGDSLGVAERYLASHPEVGAVGGRILLLDGTLQEAGCIIWQDGRASLVGRGLPALDPSAAFVRPVDYCSAVFLLTPRELFLRLGRFDETFSPGYYEDTDYCVRLAQHGKRVVYHPEIAVLHYESATSTTTHRVSDLIARNRGWFVAKHQWWLKDHYESDFDNILWARMTEQAAGRVLLIDEYVPNVNVPASYRTTRLMKYLIGAGYFVTYIPLLEPSAQILTLAGAMPQEVELVTKWNWEHVETFVAERRGYYCAILSPLPEIQKKIYQLLQFDRQALGTPPCAKNGVTAPKQNRAA